jgi:type IV pilus assembly protein PilM
VVFGRGGQISFVKQIPIGGKNFIEEVAGKLGISSAEAEMLRKNLRKESDASRPKAGSKRKSGSNNRKLDAATRQVITDAISSVANDLAKEISLCLRYYTVTFRGKRVQKATFAGGGAYEDILLDVLRDQLAVEVELAEPLRGFDLSSEANSVRFEGDRRGRLCEWAVAVGLSLKGRKDIRNNRNKSSERVLGPI